MNYELPNDLCKTVLLNAFHHRYVDETSNYAGLAVGSMPNDNVILLHCDFFFAINKLFKVVLQLLP